MITIIYCILYCHRYSRTYGYEKKWQTSMNHKWENTGHYFRLHVYLLIKYKNCEKCSNSTRGI